MATEQRAGMMKTPFLLAGTLLLLASCKDKPTPTWTVKMVSSGKVCFDKDRSYTFGSGKFECTEYKSKDKGPAMIQDYTHCYVAITGKPSSEKKLLGKLENCEIELEGQKYAFSGFTGDKAVMTQGETKVELTCVDNKDLNELDTFDNCQAYISSRYP